MTFFKKIWTACFLVIFVFGIVVSPGAWAITVQEELELSQEFMTYVNRQYNLVKDPYIVNYINDLGQKMLQHFPPQPFEFHFYVVNQEVYNAFAGPAGHVFINSGLFAAMDSEAELAGILGHEISHVTCRHISQSIERSGKIQVGTMAGVLAGILLGVAGSGTASEAVVVSSMAAGQSAYLTHSRADEREADEVGVKALVAAGYPVQGLVTMLKKIKEKDWYGSDIPSYLSTHPAVDERIVYLSRFMDFNEESPSNQERSEFEFRRAHARVLAFYGDSTKASAWFKDLAKKEPESHIPDYGLGMLALRENRLEEAETHLRKVLKTRALDPLVLADLGQVYFMGGKYEEARGLLEPAVKMDTRNYDGRLYLGRTLLALEDYPGAQSTFERLCADEPDYYLALYYLGETYSKEGRNAESHYYLGLYYLQRNDLQRATFNLKRAQTEAEDDALRQKIETALKKAQDEETKEKKKKEEESQESDSSQELRLWSGQIGTSDSGGF